MSNNLGSAGSRSIPPHGRLLPCAAVAIGILLVGCSPDDGGEPDPKASDQAEDGQDGGENDNAGEEGEQGEEGGSEGEQAGPPDEAVAEVEQGSDTATAEPGSAQGNLGLFTSRVFDGIAGVQVFVSGAQPTDDGMQFTVTGQSDGVRQQAPEFTQDAFYVVVDGEQMQPDQEFSYAPAPDEPQGNESNEFTLSIPGAPESGLLAFKGPAGEGGELPAVGLCYDAAEDLFSTEYEQCS